MSNPIFDLDNDFKPMNKNRELYNDFADKISDYTMLPFEIDFDAGYKAGNGTAMFVPLVDSDHYLNDSNYKGDLYDLFDEGDDDWEEVTMDDIECDAGGILSFDKDPETGKISFEETFEWNANVRDRQLDYWYTEFTSGAQEEKACELILRFVDLQCRDRLGKSLEELLDGPEISTMQS